MPVMSSATPAMRRAQLSCWRPLSGAYGRCTWRDVLVIEKHSRLRCNVPESFLHRNLLAAVMKGTCDMVLVLFVLCVKVMLRRW